MTDTAILWLRRDLRLDDNPALQAALAGGARLIPLYIHAPDEEAPWAAGAASRWWLHGSLTALGKSLAAQGQPLWVRSGPSLAVLREVAAATGATRVHWNRLYEPACIARDTQIKQALRADGLACSSHNAALLFEPWEIRTASGEPYKVFSAFWRACLKRGLPSAAVPPPTAWPAAPAGAPPLDLAPLDLLPRIHWDAGLQATWTPGESAAQERAARFIAQPIGDYGEQRDRPDLPATSALSAYLHFGEISPRRLLALIGAHHGDPLAEAAAPFVRELGWREFGHHLLYHFPDTTEQPLNPRFRDFPWETDDQVAASHLAAWQRGQTGIPLVDAGMRELWQTGWMHNRVRMVVASLLTKNLLLPWQAGARWFWDTLVDADLANNTLGWQWTAGCGADAAPYFRVFNPIRQGERFDPEGAYVRHWCPELARLPNAHLQAPWEAPAAVLRAAGVQLGTHYPHPIVDLAESRQRALAIWEDIKGS